jgi:acyl-homoserine lactone acylase PvdQ
LLRLRPVLAIYVSLAFPAFSEKVEILRDDFGVPHVFASTPRGALFGAGYAQAQDRLEELLKNYRRAEGTMAEVFGPQFFQNDLRQRVWKHAEVSRRRYPELKPEIRALVEAYLAGVERYMKEHPNEVPAWAPKLEPWRVIALGRYIIWGWPEGEAGGDLMRGGIQPNPLAYRGSNQMLLAPSRTAMKAPIAVIDPHLSWYGEFRFYEIRLYAKNFALSGASILGLPFPSLGHNRHLSIAMTTGGPDTSDIFEEEIKDGKYRFKDEWRPVVTRKERIGVMQDGKVEWREVTLAETHHGPIIGWKDGKGYAAAIPYAEEVNLVEQSWRIANARNLAEAKSALAMFQLMSQNVMIGTVDGDIYYLRNGRVPIRPKGCDSSRPMPGATGQCEWEGIHPLSDLLQIHNPPQGYMQNNNTSPEWMMKDSPEPPEKWKDRFYLYNIAPGPPHQRAAMTLEQLSRADRVTVEQMFDIAFSPEVFRAETWQERVRRAQNPPGAMAQLILNWNRRSDADSRAALAFYLFKRALGQHARAIEPPAALTDADVVAALTKAEQELTTQFPPNATYGTLFRVGREGTGRTWPVSGGSLMDVGMATPRAIGFNKVGNEMVGTRGQTSTQIVVLTKPPQSWMVLPLGESDHKDSPHYDDQAEKLFSRSRAKPTWFLNRRELEKHVTARIRLAY